MRLQPLPRERQGAAGVQDVVDDQHLSPGQVQADVGGHLDRARTDLGIGVARQPHEIHRAGDALAVQRAHQIGHEDEAALEQADDHHLAAGNIGDLAGHFVDAPGDCRFINKGGMGAQDARYLQVTGAFGELRPRFLQILDIFAIGSTVVG